MARGLYPPYSRGGHTGVDWNGSARRVLCNHAGTPPEKSGTSPGAPNPAASNGQRRPKCARSGHLVRVATSAISPARPVISNGTGPSRGFPLSARHRLLTGASASMAHAVPNHARRPPPTTHHQALRHHSPCPLPHRQRKAPGASAGGCWTERGNRDYRWERSTSSTRSVVIWPFRIVQISMPPLRMSPFWSKSALVAAPS